MASCLAHACQSQVFDMYGYYYSTRDDGAMLGFSNVTDACLNYEPW